MNTKSFPPWKTAVCLAWAVLIPLGLSASSPAVPERPVDDTASLEDQEIPVTEKNTYPYVDIHGDYRWLWGRGQFRADSRTAPDKVRRHDERIYLTTRRLRLFPFVHFDERTSLRTQLEDLRNDKEPDANHHLYLGRLYVQHEQARLKVEAGRFNYYLLDGNVIDKKVGGLRLRLGQRRLFPEEPSRHGLDGRLPGNGHRHEPDGLLLTDRRVTFIGRFHGKTDQALMAGLAEHVADMETDRPLTDLQFISDFLIRQVLTDQAEDIQLPVHQADMAGPKGHFFPYIREQVLPGQGPLQAVDEITGGTLFVDEAVCPSVAGHFNKAYILEPGHDDNLLAGVFLFQAPRQSDAAVLPFHADIQEDGVGSEPVASRFDEFRKRQGTDDFNMPLAFKYFLQSFKQDFLVVYDDQSDHGSPPFLQ